MLRVKGSFKTTEYSKTTSIQFMTTDTVILLPVSLKVELHMNFFKGFLHKERRSEGRVAKSSNGPRFESFSANVTTFGLRFGLKNLFLFQNCNFENNIGPEEIPILVLGQHKRPQT